MKFRIRENRCTGCHLCQLACSSTKEGAFSLRRARIRILPDERPKPRMIVCRQCKTCQCIENCPYQAFQKDPRTGGVRIDAETCQACFACIDTCPFGAVRTDPKAKLPMVCDLCGGEPVCTAVCKSAALQTVDPPLVREAGV
jgi:Fe-S-cluster-containing dehydrogenase component